MPRVSGAKVLLCLAMASAVSMAGAVHLRQQTQKIATVDFYFAPVCGYCHEWVTTSLQNLLSLPEFKPYLGTLVAVKPHALFFEGDKTERAQQKLSLAVNCANEHLNRTQVIDVLTCIEGGITRESNVNVLVDTCVSNIYDDAKLVSCMDDSSTSMNFQKSIFKSAPKSFLTDGGYKVPYFSVDGQEMPSLQTEEGLATFICEQIVKSGDEPPSACAPLIAQPEDESASEAGSQCGEGSPCLVSTLRQETHPVPAWVARMEPGGMRR